MNSTVRCGACGATNNLSIPEIKSRTCVSCGRIIDVNGVVLKEKSVLSISRKDISIGGNITIDDQEFTVLGFGIFVGYEEYDGESWYWEEYYLGGRKSIHILIFDQYDKKFFVYIPYKGSRFSSHAATHSRYKLEDTYTAKMIYACGELPFLIEGKEEFSINEWKRGNKLFTEEIYKKSHLVFAGIWVNEVKKDSKYKIALSKKSLEKNFSSKRMKRPHRFMTQLTGNLVWFSIITFVFSLIGFFYLLVLVI